MKLSFVQRKVLRLVIDRFPEAVFIKGAGTRAAQILVRAELMHVDKLGVFNGAFYAMTDDEHRRAMLVINS